MWRRRICLFLVYPSVCSKTFSALQCESFEDGSAYLIADLSIDCHAPWRGFWVTYACVMIAVYALGVPALFASVLWWHRDAINPSHPIRGITKDDPRYPRLAVAARAKDPSISHLVFL